MKLLKYLLHCLHFLLRVTDITIENSVFLYTSWQVNVLQDVLIISQFIRSNGEVLPQHVTGLCYKAHLRLQRVVQQAQLAGTLYIQLSCIIYVLS